jgi:hypothetical protein
MQLTVLSNRRDIDSAIKQLTITLTRGARRFRRIVGWPSGREEHHVFWRPELGFWCLIREEQEKWWFGYGLEDPAHEDVLSMTVQINPTKSLSAFRTGACILSDSGGSRYLCHTGRLTKGYGPMKTGAFIRNYDGPLASVVDGNGTQIREVVLIGPVGSPDLLERIGAFVRSVRDFKDGKTSSRGSVEDHPANFLRSLEFSGRRAEYERQGTIQSKVQHGLVVNALLKLLRIGHRAERTALIDVGIVRSGAITHLFEVKTTLQSQSIYKALGQLFYHSSTVGSDPKKILVIPPRLSYRCSKCISDLGISIVVYRLVGGSVQFEGLTESIKT